MTDCPPAASAFCFRSTGGSVNAVAAPLELRLSGQTAEGLAVLVPLLGCGEEAAALAFDGMAAAPPLAHAALATIAAEERVHDVLLKQVAASLPSIDRTSAALHASKRFHISLGRGGAGLHLGRIAAIDAALCLVIARLIRPGTPIAAEPQLHRIFARIHRDEARHVRVSRTLAIAGLPVARLRNVGAAAREAMADIIALAGESFDALSVDPDAVRRDVARLPDGLFTA